MTTHRFGLIGLGNAAEIHAAALAEIEGASLVAGAARSEESADAFAAEHGCVTYTDVEAMLEDAAPDVVGVCTPSGAHLDPALAALERDVHVLCEKPLEVTADRIDRMAAAAEASDARLGGVFQQRYNPVVRTVQEAVAEGRFGSVSVINTYVPWWRDDEYYAPERWQGDRDLDGGGALMSQSIHGVDAVQWLAGTAAGIDRETNPVAEVYADDSRAGHDLDHLESEDTAVAVLRYRDGTLGQLLGATSMYPGSLKRIQVAGRDGTAEIREDELITWQFREEREGDPAIREEFTSTDSGGGAADPMAIDYSNHTRNIRAFLEAIEADEPFMLDAREARKAVEIIESVYASAERGEPVRIE